MFHKFFDLWLLHPMTATPPVHFTCTSVRFASDKNLNAKRVMKLSQTDTCYKKACALEFKMAMQSLSPKVIITMWPCNAITLTTSPPQHSNPLQERQCLSFAFKAVVTMQPSCTVRHTMTSPSPQYVIITNSASDNTAATTTTSNLRASTTSAGSPGCH